MFVAGYYEAGDSGMIDEDGYISVMARTDEVINVAGGLAARAHCLLSVVAGHRLSTGALEEVVLREVSRLHLPWSTLALEHKCHPCYKLIVLVEQSKHRIRCVEQTWTKPLPEIDSDQINCHTDKWIACRRSQAWSSVR